jgi:hypothetical protein
MTRVEPPRNAYEEHADELKELLENSKGEKGNNPGRFSSRAALLQEHERHLKFLAESVRQPRNFILPPSYRPSRTLPSQTKYINLTDLRLGTRNSSKSILLRTIAEPYVYSASITIVEDANCGVARLTVCNLDDSSSDPVIPRGSLLCVKQPCWSQSVNGGYHIRVVHPSDLMILDANSELLPPSWKHLKVIGDKKAVMHWKQEGDRMFLKKKFRKALDWYVHRFTLRQSADLLISYERGRQLLTPSDYASQIEMYRKRCNVNIILLRFDDAASDLAQAISFHAQMDTTSAISQLTKASTIQAWLHDPEVSDLLQIAPDLPRALKDLATRIKFDLGINQSTPSYDLAAISSYVGPLTLHVDAPNYISDTEIRQTTHHGRGLFAKQDFKVGDLLMAEKAFALPGYIFGDFNSECSLYSLGDGTATDRAGALLLKELLQKLEANPSMRRSFFDMDDGGYWAENGWEGADGEQIPVDV